MRTWLYCAGTLLLASSCRPQQEERARTEAGRAAAASQLDIRITRSVAPSGPAVDLTVTNRSAAPVCIRAEVLQNPYTYELELRMRDAHGRGVGLHTEGGYIPEPFSQIVRLEPGETVIGQYGLASRFKRIGPRDKVRPGWSARARFRYGDCRPVEAYCDDRLGSCPDSSSSMAESGWQTL